MKSPALGLLLSLLATLLPTGAGAQDPDLRAAGQLRAPELSGQLVSMGANAALGGVAAGVVRKLRGGSFRDGMAWGALGGGIAYLGKRVTVERFDGAGLAGRQIAALGNSVMGNAAAGRGGLERLVVPIGFARLYLEPGAETRASLRIDLHGLLWTVYAVATPELRFDAPASLSAGSPVFRSAGYTLRWDETGDEVAGFAPAGVILLSDLRGIDGLDAGMSPVIFAHERVHVIQYDQVFAAASAPLQEWLLPRLRGGARIGRLLDVDLASLFVYGVSIGYGGDRGLPWEVEAHYLAGHR